MKTIKITFVLTAFLLTASLSFSQSFEGRLSIKGLTRSTTIKQKTPVALFKAFKDGVYSINFNFKTTNVASDGMVLFDMKTTVKHNGKTISETSRKGWPWLPGDMFVPIEAFDAIPAWQKFAAKGLPINIPGNYEIILQFVPSEGQNVKGSISPATMKFTID
ncbi:MAG: hypothetical protein GW839_00010 [Flavobacteriales bacterium]|nr:hypothetical protein [Flavobacteriales bacterium]